MVANVSTGLDFNIELDNILTQTPASDIDLNRFNGALLANSAESKGLSLEDAKDLKRLGEAASKAKGWALVDGPLPFGDAYGAYKVLEEALSIVQERLQQAPVPTLINDVDDVGDELK